MLVAFSQALAIPAVSKLVDEEGLAKSVSSDEAIFHMEDLDLEAGGTT